MRSVTLINLSVKITVIKINIDHIIMLIMVTTMMTASMITVMLMITNYKYDDCIHNIVNGRENDDFDK